MIKAVKIDHLKLIEQKWEGHNRSINNWSDLKIDLTKMTL